MFVKSVSLLFKLSYQTTDCSHNSQTQEGYF